MLLPCWDDSRPGRLTHLAICLVLHAKAPGQIVVCALHVPQACWIAAIVASGTAVISIGWQVRAVGAALARLPAVLAALGHAVPAFQATFEEKVRRRKCKD